MPRSVLLVLLSLVTPAAVHAAAAAPRRAAGAFGGDPPAIVNGTLTAEDPSTGALLSPGNPAAARLLCSGTLIGCETFLTAAHCVCDTIGPDCQGANAPDPSRYVVFLQHAGFFPVASISVHPDFDFPVGDVAVVKLAAPVAGIAPTPINGVRAPASGTTAAIVGFGRTAGAFDYGIKRRGTVELAPCTGGVSGTTSVCWDFVSPLGLPGEDSNTCNGDSGGPLFVDFGCGDTVAGITSGGSSASCQPTDHGYDANVYNYRAFVQAEGGADLANASCGAMPQTGEANTTIAAASGTVDAANPQATHSFTVAAGTARLRVAMNASDPGGNDFDLYVKQASPPTTLDFDCAASGGGQFGFCEFVTPAAGTWHVLINRFAGAGMYQVTATSFAAGSPGPGMNGQPCDDQNACTASDVCQGGACGGSPVANGTACDDGRACTGADACQGGACAGAAAPLGGCRQPFVPGRASLLVKDGVPDARDTLAWRWLKGAATQRAEFGDPTTTTDYELCVFDETAGVPALVLEASIPAGGNWKPTSRGYKYKDRAALAAGVSGVLLKDGAGGAASIVVKGRGDNLATPALPLSPDGTVTVQLLNPSTCWEASYGTNIVNDARQFKAKAD